MNKKLLLIIGILSLIILTGCEQRSCLDEIAEKHCLEKNETFYQVGDGSLFMTRDYSCFRNGNEGELYYYLLSDEEYYHCTEKRW